MLSLIVATDLNYGIGKDNKLLVNIPYDLKRFKDITSNHTIIMGRKTFESLPKILPNRHHIIITKNRSYKVLSDNVTVVNNIDEVLNKYLFIDEEAFVIGGANIYTQLAPYCKNFYVTQILERFEADSYFDYSKYGINSIQESDIMEFNSIKYKFIDIKVGE